MDVAKLLRDPAAVRAVNFATLPPNHKAALTTPKALGLIVQYLSGKVNAADPAAVEDVLRLIAGILVSSPAAAIPYLVKSTELIAILTQDLEIIAESEVVAELVCSVLEQLCNSPDGLHQVVASEGGAALLKIIEANKSANIVIPAGRALTRIANGNSQFQEEVRSGGGIVTLLDVMEQLIAEPTVIEVYTDTLTAICQSEENVEAFGNEGGMDIVLNTLNKYIDIPSVVLSAARCLALLMQSDVIRQIVAEDGGVDVVIATAARYTADAEVTTALSKAMMELLGNDALRATAIDQGMVQVLLAALHRTAADNTTLQKIILGCLLTTLFPPLTTAARGMFLNEEDSMGTLVNLLRNCASGANSQGRFEVLVEVAKVLVMLTEKSPPVQKGIVAAHGLAAAAAALRGAVGSSGIGLEVQQTLLALLVNFASIAQNHSMLCQEGCVDAIIRSLNAHATDQHIVQRSAFILSNIALDTQCRRTVLELKGAHALITCAEANIRQPKHGPPQMSREAEQSIGRCLKALVSLCTPSTDDGIDTGVANARHILVNAGVVKLTGTLLAIVTPEQDALCEQCLALANSIASIGDDDADEPDEPCLEHVTLVEGGIISHVVRQLKTFSGNPAVVLQCLAVLSNLSSKSIPQGFRDIAYTTETLAAIMSAMLSNIAISDVQIAACWVLEKFGLDQENIGVLIMKSNGIVTVLKVLSHHENDENVVAKALEVISNVAEDETNLSALRAEMGVEFLVKLLHKHRAHAVIAEALCFILGKLASAFPAEVAKYGALDEIVATLEAHEQSDEIGQYGWMALEKIFLVGTEMKLLPSAATQLCSAFASGWRRAPIFPVALATLSAASSVSAHDLRVTSLPSHMTDVLLEVPEEATVCWNILANLSDDADASIRDPIAKRAGTALFAVLESADPATTAWGWKLLGNLANLKLAEQLLAAGVEKALLEAFRTAPDPHTQITVGYAAASLATCLPQSSIAASCSQAIAAATQGQAVLTERQLQLCKSILAPTKKVEQTQEVKAAKPPIEPDQEKKKGTKMKEKKKDDKREKTEEIRPEIAPLGPGPQELRDSTKLLLADVVRHDDEIASLLIEIKHKIATPKAAPPAKEQPSREIEELKSQISKFESLISALNVENEDVKKNSQALNRELAEVEGVLRTAAPEKADLNIVELAKAIVAKGDEASQATRETDIQTDLSLQSFTTIDALTDEVRKKVEAAEKQEERIHGLEAGFRDRELLCAKKEQEFVDKEAREGSLENREAEFAKRVSAFEMQEQLAAARDATILQREKMIADREAREGSLFDREATLLRREAAVTARDDAFAITQASVAARERAIEEKEVKEGRLIVREAQLAAQTEDLAKREALLLSRTAVIVAREQAMSEKERLEGHVVSRENALKATEQRILERETAVTSREASVAHREQQMAEREALEGKILVREQEVTQRELKVSTADADISKREADVNLRQRLLEEREAAEGLVIAREKAIKLRETAVSDREREVTVSEENVSQRDTLVTKREEEVNGLLSSVAERELAVTEREHLHQQRSKETEELDSNLKAKLLHTETREQAVSQLENEIRERNEALIQAEDDFKTRDTTLKHKEAAIAKSEEELRVQSTELQSRELRATEQEKQSLERLQQAKECEENAAKMTRQTEELQLLLEAREKAMDESEANLRERLQQLERSEEDCKKRTKELVTREKRAEEQLADLDWREKAVAHKAREEDVRTQALDRRDLEIKEREKVLSDKAAEADQRAKANVVKEKELHVKEKDLDRRELATKERVKKCDQREEELLKRQADLTASEELASRREAQATAREQEISLRDADLARRELNVQTQSDNLEAVRVEIRRLELELNEKEESYRVRNRELQDKRRDVEKREKALVEWMKEMQWREGDFEEREEANERPLLTLSGQLKRKKFNEALVSVQLNRMRENYITSKERMLRQRAQRNDLPDVRAHRREFLNEVSDVTTLKALTTETREKAATFRRAMAKLRGFGDEASDTSQGRANGRPDTSEAVSDQEQLAFGSRAKEVFSAKDQKDLRAIMGRDRELREELAFMLHIQVCPMADRHKFVNDTELVVALEQWWLDCCGRAHERHMQVLKERIARLDEGLAIFETKRELIPELLATTRPSGPVPLATKKRGGNLFSATFPVMEYSVKPAQDPLRQRPYSTPLTSTRHDREIASASPYGKLPYSVSDTRGLRKWMSRSPSKGSRSASKKRTTITKQEDEPISAPPASKTDTLFSKDPLNETPRASKSRSRSRTPSPAPSRKSSRRPSSHSKASDDEYDDDTKASDDDHQSTSNRSSSRSRSDSQSDAD
eukprot:TRINITY_DN9187_c0_g1_i2.p1 TRINITY_DN9187_c0_g1~~TRINITY_DN9187_c0_g1_i2.p1  ORF type:complete len:2325 (-),score=465.64 TRINITY_DN9187_c0_g1_i2:4-6978(-)